MGGKGNRDRYRLFVEYRDRPGELVAWKDRMGQQVFSAPLARRRAMYVKKSPRVADVQMVWVEGERASV